MQNKMFCSQWQETSGCSGCTKFCVCWKSPELANMQDLLIYVTKGLSEVTTRLRKEGPIIIPIRIMPIREGNFNFSASFPLKCAKNPIKIKLKIISIILVNIRNLQFKIIKKANEFHNKKSCRSH